MKASSKLVQEVLVQVRDTQHLPASKRLRGLKPSAVAFAYTERLIGDREWQGNVVLAKKGAEVLTAAGHPSVGWGR